MERAAHGEWTSLRSSHPLREETRAGQSWLALLRGMMREIDLALQFEHAVLEHANASDEGSLASFDLPNTMTVGFREAVECLQQFGLAVAERLLEVVELVVHLGSQDGDVLLQFPPHIGDVVLQLRPHMGEILLQFRPHIGEVLLQFLAESVILSLAGGLMGIALGAILALGIGKGFGLTLTVTPTYIILSVFISTAVGVASGLYPARRAAKMDPITALRAES